MTTYEDEHYTTGITVRLPISLVKELDAVSKNSKFTLPDVTKKYADRSEAIKTYITIGAFVDRNSKQIRDPAFVDQLNQMILDEKYMEWMDGLSEMQLNGFKGLIELKLKNMQTRLV